MPLPYGLSISSTLAKKAAGAALAEARANNWALAVAIVDPGGTLVYFEKIDDTQNGSVTVAIEKARAAALFKRPTKVFEDQLAAGGAGLRVMSLSGVIPSEGGVPLIVGGHIVGGIGVSGGTSQQDGQCADAAATSLEHA